MLSLLI